MAPAVLLFCCLLATISCLTTEVTGQTSYVTSTPVSTRPGVTNATTTTTTQAPLRGSCASPDLCCSGLNNTCHRLNCFCDVSCLRLRDCCPDFKPTCLTVNNSTNPSNTLPLTGTCSDPTLCCSGTNNNCFRGCFCDESCKLLNDCCPDYNRTCSFNSTTTAPPFNSTIAPPFISTAAPPKALTVLEVKVKMFLTEEEHHAALLQVGTVLEKLLRENNTDIYSLKVTKIKRVSP
ncbi:uncharacterized protein LOC132114988 isoform X1 [Carassius carassius]|uniref:uncharacterized protein LOC132114988 isoform X1 n=1 Tax=Carassius carassius TaxID=217509 RepID=UPI00286857D5|nr:uncharacterized protein LOC132114988 isoform X1 [Carassius carassius]